MTDISKIFIIIAFLTIVTTVIQNLSPIISAISLPIILTITILLSINFLINKQINKDIITIILFIISISIISTGVGIHFAANEINNILLENNTFDQYIYNLDEHYSHYIIFTGIIMTFSTLYLMYKEKITKLETFVEDVVINTKKILKLDQKINLYDYLITSLSASIIGSFMSFVSLEANVEIYGSIVSIISLITILYSKKDKIKIQYQNLSILFASTLFVIYLTIIITFKITIITGIATVLKQIS